MTIAFAAHNDLASTPVKITQFQCDDFFGSQAQANQQRQHREVAPTDGRFAVTAGQ